jgi:hypothetical protein
MCLQSTVYVYTVYCIILCHLGTRTRGDLCEGLTRGGLSKHGFCEHNAQWIPGLAEQLALTTRWVTSCLQGLNENCHVAMYNTRIILQLPVELCGSGFWYTLSVYMQVWLVFLFSLVQVRFGPTDHLQMYSLVSHLLFFKVISTVLDFFLGWHCAAVHIFGVCGFRWSNFPSCFDAR